MPELEDFLRLREKQGLLPEDGLFFHALNRTFQLRVVRPHHPPEGSDPAKRPQGLSPQLPNAPRIRQIVTNGQPQDSDRRHGLHHVRRRQLQERREVRGRQHLLRVEVWQDWQVFAKAP